MLSPEMDVAQLRKELSECLNQLRTNGAAVLAIACNTLHAFLDESEDLIDLIHLPKVIVTEIPTSEIPLVLCTTTSVQFGLHKRFFPCIYPSSQTQKQIDRLMDQILKGSEQQAIIQDLLKILRAETANTIILGCTELSLFTKQLSPLNKLIIDPLEIVAKKVLRKKFFKNKGIIYVVHFWNIKTNESFLATAKRTDSCSIRF